MTPGLFLLDCFFVLLTVIVILLIVGCLSVLVFLVFYTVNSIRAGLRTPKIRPRVDIFHGKEGH